VPATFPDVHCHLDQLPDPAAAVRDALAAGVGPILAVGMQRGSNRRTLALAARFPGAVLAGVGLHPSEIPALDAAQLEAELAFVRDRLAEAAFLGEVGLDYKDAPDEAQRSRQRDALRRQLEWAAALRKPVNLHCRRAERDLLEIAAEFGRRTGLGVNLHWFTHSAKLARRGAEAGLFISPGPSILHSPEQAEVARGIAPDLLLLETDSPVEYGGEPARPLWAQRVGLHLAALRGESPPDLAARLQDNLRRYLGGG
jgi:TatD DNase family protein